MIVFIAGCNVVVSDRGYTKEYFKDYAWYCDPSRIDSIRQAILDAHHNQRNLELKRYIVENYTWDKMAEETLKAYEHLFSQ